jgi:hypothetical protein
MMKSNLDPPGIRWTNLSMWVAELKFSLFNCTVSKASRKRTKATVSARTAGPPTSPARGWFVPLKVLCIVVAGLWVFAPALHGDWDSDDRAYLSENPLRDDPHHLWKIWFMPGSAIDFYPITESVQVLQWRLWHTDSFGYILTNIVLHIVSALLIWLLLKKLGLRLAWLGGLLFVIHPMNVESVAWIAEIKNTLSLHFSSRCARGSITRRKGE